MGMVFTQLLYIDFCKPTEDIQREWNCPQFDQLLEQMGNILSVCHLFNFIRQIRDLVSFASHLGTMGRNK